MEEGRNLEPVIFRGRGRRLTSRRNLDDATEASNSASGRNIGRCSASTRGRGRSSHGCASDSAGRSRVSPPSSSRTLANVIRPRGRCSRGRNPTSVCGRNSQTAVPSSSGPTRSDLADALSGAIDRMASRVSERISSHLARRRQHSSASDISMISTNDSNTSGNSNSGSNTSISNTNTSSNQSMNNTDERSIMSINNTNGESGSSMNNTSDGSVLSMNDTNDRSAVSMNNGTIDVSSAVSSSSEHSFQDISSGFLDISSGEESGPNNPAHRIPSINNSESIIIVESSDEEDIPANGIVVVDVDVVDQFHNDSIQELTDHQHNNTANKKSNSDRRNTNRREDENQNGGSIECPVCITTLPDIKKSGLTMMSTLCGHLFCSQCMNGLFPGNTKTNNCPVCRKSIKRKDVHPIFI